MRIIFRADASVLIGTGHVMRCLTLAKALSDENTSCLFVIRNLPGHLADRIKAFGFEVMLLDPPRVPGGMAPPIHAPWAGVSWEQDAADTKAVIGDDVDWLVLDHYAFDARWQIAVAGPRTKIMVIDDLADRAHEANLILDQNLGRKPHDYDDLVPEHCNRLIGPRYALLRPEFAAGRAASRAARLRRPLQHILVTMGGTDVIDATSRVMDAISCAILPNGAHLTVVMGSNAPALKRVRTLAAQMPWPTTVLVDVLDMAELMAQADLAIGAGGSTTWERCCMGLPGIIIQTADNQANAVNAMHALGAAFNPGALQSKAFGNQLRYGLTQLMHQFQDGSMVELLGSITDGNGAHEIKMILDRSI